jgi:hypothetical protein
MVKDTPKLVTKLKHIDIYQHWLRQEIANGSIQIKWISTNDIIADGITKPLIIQKHKEFLR